MPETQIRTLSIGSVVDATVNGESCTIRLLDHGTAQCHIDVWQGDGPIRTMYCVYTAIEIAAKEE